MDDDRLRSAEGDVEHRNDVDPADPPVRRRIEPQAVPVRDHHRSEHLRHRCALQQRPGVRVEAQHLRAVARGDIVDPERAAVPRVLRARVGRILVPHDDLSRDRDGDVVGIPRAADDRHDRVRRRRRLVARPPVRATACERPQLDDVELAARAGRRRAGDEK